MINSQQPSSSFFRSLKIQLRVIYALLMREIITRYGRHNLGFAWLFVEPMMFTLGVAFMWYLTKAAHGGSLPIVPFAVIGYSTVLCWRNAVSRVGNAVQANTGLLFHRNVKVVDVFIARMLLEIAGATMSFLILSTIFNLIGWMELPADLMLIVGGWILLSWFAIALGMIVGGLSEVSEVVDRFWHTITYLLFPLSGSAFFVYWLPTAYQKYVLWLPMVHASEMIKHGYYGDLYPTFEDPVFFISCNLTMTLIGLLLLRYVSNKVEAS